MIAISLITAAIVAAVALIPIARAAATMRRLALSRLTLTRLTLALIRPPTGAISTLSITIPAFALATVAVAFGRRRSNGSDVRNRSRRDNGPVCADRLVGRLAIPPRPVPAPPTTWMLATRARTALSLLTLALLTLALLTRPLLPAALLIAAAATTLVLPLSLWLTLPILTTMPAGTPHIFHFDSGCFGSSRFGYHWDSLDSLRSCLADSRPGSGSFGIGHLGRSRFRLNSNTCRWNRIDGRPIIGKWRLDLSRHGDRRAGGSHLTNRICNLAFSSRSRFGRTVGNGHRPITLSRNRRYHRHRLALGPPLQPEAQ